MVKKKRKKGKILIFTAVFCMVILLPGCLKIGKKVWDYEMAWVCDSPYIYIGTQHIHNYEAYIEIDGEMKETETGFENDGTRIYFYEKNSKGYEEDLVWLAECKIKKDKLYLTIITDNYFECDGETFVLEQQPYEPRKTMEE